MISKKSIKLIRSLGTKKGRSVNNMFVAEGPKVVDDLIAAGFEVVELYDEIDDVRKASFLQHPQEKLAVFKIPQWQIEPQIPTDQLSLMLDGVQDPGNLGTIIRVADWFGITHVFCSHNTASCWNPKVVQATMGSIARVQVTYHDLLPLLSHLPDNFPVYGTLLDGDSIYTQQLNTNGVIVMGNEGNGVSPEIRARVNRRLLIPNYPPSRETADSLNVSVATAIVCNEFRRALALK